MSPETSAHEPPRAVQIQYLGYLTIRSDRCGEIYQIGLSGELDMAAAPQVQDALMCAEATDADAIILDLSRLTFIDSTGIGLLVAAHARSRAGSNRLALVRGPAAVQRVLETCALDRLLPFTD